MDLKSYPYNIPSNYNLKVFIDDFANKAITININ